MLDSYPTLARLISLLLYCLISTAFFLWLSYVLFRCYCHARSPSSSPLYFHEPATITAVRVMDPPQIGLDEAVIKTFPKFTYSDEKEGSDQMNKQVVSDCAVCLGTFGENEMLRRIPKCGHVFHAHCVDVWLRSHATCPCCRSNLLLDQQQRPQQ